MTYAHKNYNIFMHADTINEIQKVVTSSSLTNDEKHNLMLRLHILKKMTPDEKGHLENIVTALLENTKKDVKLLQEFFTTWDSYIWTYIEEGGDALEKKMEEGLTQIEEVGEKNG